MREFTKSMMSYTWALSMLGVQQMLNIFAPAERQEGNKATEAFNKLTDVTTQEMGDTMRSTFRAGDNLQRGIVDLMFSACRLGALDPTRWIRAGSDALRRSADAVGVRPASPSSSAPSGCCISDARASVRSRQNFGEPFRQGLRNETAQSDRGDPPTATAQSSAQGWGPMP